MKKGIPFLTFIAIACFVAGSVQAGTTVEYMPVFVNVPAACTVTTNPLNFGEHADGKSGNGGITVNCSNLLPYTVSLDAGMNFDSYERNMNDGAGHLLSYVLFKDSAQTLEWGDSDVANTFTYGTSLAGTGAGADQTLTVYGSLQSAAGKPAGTYTDTVLVTVTY